MPQINRFPVKLSTLELFDSNNISFDVLRDQNSKYDTLTVVVLR